MFENDEQSQQADEIAKIFNVTVIMRKHSVDFYYNFKFLNTLNCEVEDIDLSFEDLYLKLKAPSFDLLKRWCLEQEESLLELWLPPEMRTKDQMVTELSDKELLQIS